MPTPVPTPEPSGSLRLDTSGKGAYIQGSGGLFRPDDALTRAEAVALLARLSKDEQGNLLYNEAETASGFPDVDADAWVCPLCGLCPALGGVAGRATRTAPSVRSRR